MPREPLTLKKPHPEFRETMLFTVTLGPLLFATRNVLPLIIINSPCELGTSSRGYSTQATVARPPEDDKLPGFDTYCANIKGNYVTNNEQPKAL